MADNVLVDNVSEADYTVVTDEITSPYTGGTAQAQGVKLLSGTANANDVIPGDATNGLDVDVTRLPALPAGTNNIGDVDVVTLPNVTLAAGTNTNEVVGDVAADIAVAGNPVLIGLRASDAVPSAMSADGDAVYAWADRNGRLVTMPKCDTTAVTAVNDAAISTTLLSANAARTGATVHNDSTVALYLKLGATASTTSFTVKMAADSYYEVPYGYTGVIDGIWASDASGAARITELSGCSCSFDLGPRVLWWLSRGISTLRRLLVVSTSRARAEWR